MPRVAAFLPLALAASLGASACGDSTPIRGDTPAASRAAANDPLAPQRVPISATAKLASIAMQTWIYERPDRAARKLGYLRLGASVLRSEHPVAGTGCLGAFYAIEHGGFVCAATGPRDPSAKGAPPDEATLDLGDPTLRALAHPPDLSKPLPYPYAFVRANAALYLQIPTWKEQLRFEYGVREHRKAFAKSAKGWNTVDQGSPNDVPLDARGVAATPPEAPYPPPPAASSEAEWFGTTPDDRPPFWLHETPVPDARGRYDRDIPNVSSFVAPPYAVLGGRVARHAGVTLLGTSFVAGERSRHRRFAITLDGRLVATDKLKPHFPSAFHGVAIDGKTVRFPFGFVKRHHAHAYERVEARTEWPARGELPFRSVVALTGKERRYETARYLEMDGGRWVRVEDIAYVDAPREMPTEFDYAKTKWIDVSIWRQTLVAWEGSRPVYATLVSTGVDGMGDPKTSKSTLRGAFRIDTKHVTATMDADDIENKFELRDVPWVQFFEQGYALHATYWHDDFGKPRSHGCVNLSPIDAHYLFFWTDPPLPDGWHGVRSGGAFGPGTWVRVHA